MSKHDELASKVKPRSIQQSRLLEASLEIAIKPAKYGDENMAFNHSIFCQVGLPRSKVEGREFMRKSGRAWVSIQAGMLDEGRGPVEQQIPYGSMPRLALAFMSTYAVQNKERQIPIGDSASAFLKYIGLDSQGNRHLQLRQQMFALAACRMQLGFDGVTFNDQPVEQFEVWMNRKEESQRSLWPGKILLSESYFKSLIESAVPLDLRALHALRGSALALDVYTWLAQRLHRIEGRPPILHWKSLRDQFAQEYTGIEADKNFKKAFLPALQKVKNVYPKAKVLSIKGGIQLYPSQPPIPKRTN